MMNKMEKIRQAVADYMWTESCSCCSCCSSTDDMEAHDKHAERLARLLAVEKYDDGSGYNFSKYRSEE